MSSSGQASSNYTPPAECFSHRDAVPTGELDAVLDHYGAVPLWQGMNSTKNYRAVLQSCCPTSVWIYSDPQPCTAVCNLTTTQQADTMQSCLELASVDSAVKGSAGSAIRPPELMSTFLLLLAGWSLFYRVVR